MNFKLSSLYVGDLHPEVTDFMLAEKFSPAGQIHSVRVCKNWNTGASFGYAYVNFYQQTDAERALETLNCELLLGQPMRVMWSQRDATIRKSGVGNLFVKNLDLLTIDSMALFDLFSVFGKVLSCKVVAYKTGTKGYGYIQFESQEAANLAKERLDGKLFNNHKVSIEHFKTREDREAEVNHHAPGFNNKLKAVSKKERQEKSAHRNVQRMEKVQKTAPSLTLSQKLKPTKSYAQAVETVPAVDITVEECLSPTQVPAVDEKPLPLQLPAVDEKSLPPEVPAVDEKPPPPHVPAVEERPVSSQVPAVEENPVSSQVPAVEESPVSSQVPAAEENPVSSQAPAVEEKPAPLQAPAVEEKPAPLQAPAVEEKPAPLQAPAVEEKPAPVHAPAVGEKPAPVHAPAVGEKPAPPQVPAVEEKPAPPQVPAVEEKPDPPQVPAVEEKPAPLQAPAVEEKPAPLQAPAVEEKPAPPQIPAVEEKPAPPQVDKMDILLKAVEAVKLETLSTVSGMKKQRNSKRKKMTN